MIYFVDKLHINSIETKQLLFIFFFILVISSNRFLVFVHSAWRQQAFFLTNNTGQHFFGIFDRKRVTTISVHVHRKYVCVYVSNGKLIEICVSLIIFIDLKEYLRKNFLYLLELDFFRNFHFLLILNLFSKASRKMTIVLRKSNS